MPWIGITNIGERWHGYIPHWACGALGSTRRTPRYAINPVTIHLTLGVDISGSRVQQQRHVAPFEARGCLSTVVSGHGPLGPGDGCIWQLGTDRINDVLRMRTTAGAITTL